MAQVADDKTSSDVSIWYFLDSGDEGEKADLTKSGYQKTSDTAEHNLALTLSGNRGSAMHHMLTLITFTVFLSYL